MDLQTFERLANDQGLVRMRIVESFAPYDRGAMAGFPPDRALLLADHKAAFPCDEHGDPIHVAKPAAPATQDTSPPSVAIPDGWEGTHHLVRLRLAEEISGQMPTKVAEADDIIRAELERRKDQS